MTTLLKAAQQALEALENAEDHLAKPYSTDASKAITALRAVLVEPEQDRALQWGAAPARIEFGSSPNCWREAFLPLGKDNTLRLLAETEALPLVENALRAALAQQAEPLTIERLRDALVASRIIPPAAVEDPDGYDDGVTLFRIEALHRRIT